MSEPNTKCYFRYEGGDYCKRWAQHGSRFCFNHQPQADGAARPARHFRLATPDDLLNLMRETLLGLHDGSVSPARASATSSLCALWLKVYDKTWRDERPRGFHNPMPADFSPSDLAEDEDEVPFEEVDKKLAQQLQVDRAEGERALQAVMSRILGLAQPAALPATEEPRRPPASTAARPGDPLG